MLRRSGAAPRLRPGRFGRTRRGHGPVQADCGVPARHGVPAGEAGQAGGPQLRRAARCGVPCVRWSVWGQEVRMCMRAQQQQRRQQRGPACAAHRRPAATRATTAGCAARPAWPSSSAVALHLCTPSCGSVAAPSTLHARCLSAYPACMQTYPTTFNALLLGSHARARARTGQGPPRVSRGQRRVPGHDGGGRGAWGVGHGAWGLHVGRGAWRA